MTKMPPPAAAPRWGVGPPSSFAVAGWLFMRLLGVTYLAAFWSLDRQILGLVGHDGILPARLYMDGARAFTIAQHIGIDRFRLLPTLCWLGTSDAFLRGICLGGVAGAALLTLGIAPVLVLPVLWFSYLSLSIVCRDFLSYQWDALLLETGLIAIFVAPLVDRERWCERVGPPRLGRWLMLWLLFRLMVGSGAVKLASGDPTWQNLTALTFHFETQPLPTPLAWYFHHLPLWFQKASTAAVIGIELVAPWFMVGSRRLRATAFVLLTGLQTLIALTGNYAFFNLLSASLCLFLLDDATLAGGRRKVQPARAWTASTRAGDEATKERCAARIRHAATSAFAIDTVPVSALMFLGSLGIELPGAALVAPVARFVAPLRSVNSYGLFAVMTTTRDEIVVEGSEDGVNWTAYEFTDKPGDVDRRPRWVAPHQPRLDWQMWFAALTTYADARWFHQFCLRLLEGSPEVLRLLSRNPFPDGPPHHVRGVLYRYHFSDAATRRGGGAWWVREPVGDYSPTLSRAR